MNPVIAIIGAGSVAFARKIVNDLLFVEEFGEAEIRLMDIDETRLSFAVNTIKLVAEKRGATPRITAGTSKREALDGADFVVTMIQVGGEAATKVDFDVCRRHGLKLVIGDTMGVPAISRALRTVPALLSVCRDMEELCPSATLLNYSNPMGMVMGALQRGSEIASVGLCHGVFGTAMKLARFIDVDFSRVNYLCAGINHMAFFIKYEVDGEDAYPLIRRAFDTTHKNDELVRQEMFRRFGYFMTESSFHLSEYVPYFVKSDELIEEFDIAVDEYLARSAENTEIFRKVETAFREGRNLLAGNGESITITPRSRMRKGHAEAGEVVEAFSIPDTRSSEYASYICEALWTGRRFSFNGNLLNSGSITNLPESACTEVPCLVDRNGIQPTVVGDLPAQCAALIATNVNVQELTVRALLEENRDHVYHAALLSPLASAVLSTKTIVALVDDLLAAQRRHLPAWCMD
jgi:alpha-galactosidase